jgi:putative phosphoesterase
MKVLIISDSHGNIANLKFVMSFARKFGVSAVIHAGDWNTVESVETVLFFGIPLYAVLGNADIDPTVAKTLGEKCKKFNEGHLIINLDDKNIGITHKPADNKKFFGGTKLDLIINGHLHSRYVSKKKGVKIIRPGAIIRGNNFAIYDTASGKIEFIEDDEV